MEMQEGSPTTDGYKSALIRPSFSTIQSAFHNLTVTLKNLQTCTFLSSLFLPLLALLWLPPLHLSVPLHVSKICKTLTWW